MTTDTFEAFLLEPHVGVLSTLRRDGMPYTVPVWWLWKDGTVWLTGTYSRVWCKHLLHDPRVSLCIEATAPVAGHVGFDGV
ncbi:MAG TPA: pyridoxamine 5'-phosphate oxidase family protein, partial [Tepidiformaceae bacterium]|nr:pyridoxamine 5'-phosphate oxidase family protein [Tepidiformaceae bacterium]